MTKQADTGGSITYEQNPRTRLHELRHFKPLTYLYLVDVTSSSFSFLRATLVDILRNGN